jgi:hypothetical protein
MGDDGSDQNQVAPQLADQSCPSWFGSWSWGRIVFVSDLDGGNDIWEVFPGHAPTSLHQTTFNEAQVGVSAAFGFAFVRIKPDGESRILYEDRSYGDQVSPVTDRGDHADADAAQSVRDNTGSFLNASATQMYEALPALSYNQSGVASTGDSVMSIDAEDGVWAAAALSRDGTCFLIKIAEGSGEPTRAPHLHGLGRGGAGSPPCLAGRVSVSISDPQSRLFADAFR